MARRDTPTTLRRADVACVFVLAGARRPRGDAVARSSARLDRAFAYSSIAWVSSSYSPRSRDNPRRAFGLTQIRRRGRLARRSDEDASHRARRCALRRGRARLDRPSARPRRRRRRARLLRDGRRPRGGALRGMARLRPAASPGDDGDEGAERSVREAPTSGPACWLRLERALGRCARCADAYHRRVDAWNDEADLEDGLGGDEDAAVLAALLRERADARLVSRARDVRATLEKRTRERDPRSDRDTTPPDVLHAFLAVCREALAVPGCSRAPPETFDAAGAARRRRRARAGRVRRPARVARRSSGRDRTTRGAPTTPRAPLERDSTRREATLRGWEARRR